MSEHVNAQTREILADLLDVLDVDTSQPEELQARAAFLRGVLRGTVNNTATPLDVLHDGIRSAAEHTDAHPGLPPIHQPNTHEGAPVSDQTTIQPGDSDQCAMRRPGATTGLGAGRLPCILEAGHDGEHLDAFSRAFANPEHTSDAPDTDEHTAAWHVASSDRGPDNPPHEVYMLADLVELYTWAGTRGVRVHLVSTHPDGRAIYAAHCGKRSRVAKGPPRERTWTQAGSRPERSV